MHIIHSSKPIECTTPIVNLNVFELCNLGYDEVTVIVESLIVTNVPHWCRVLIGESYGVGNREYTGTLYFLLNFAMIPKLLEKIKSILIKCTVTFEQCFQ